jgi:hypothetical protein
MFYNEVTTDQHSNPTSRQRGYLLDSIRASR